MEISVYEILVIKNYVYFEMPKELIKKILKEIYKIDKTKPAILGELDFYNETTNKQIISTLHDT